MARNNNGLAFAIVLFVGFVILDITGAINWGSAQSLWDTYKGLLLPVIGIIVVFLGVAITVRSARNH